MTASGASQMADRWAVLASTVQERMYELELDQRSLADRADVSSAVVRDLQRGEAKNYQLGTLLAVAIGLDLHPLALVAVLAGDDAAEGLGVALQCRHPTERLSFPDGLGVAS